MWLKVNFLRKYAVKYDMNWLKNRWVLCFAFLHVSNDLLVLIWIHYSEVALLDIILNNTAHSLNKLSHLLHFDSLYVLRYIYLLILKQNLALIVSVQISERAWVLLLKVLINDLILINFVNNELALFLAVLNPPCWHNLHPPGNGQQEFGVTYELGRVVSHIDVKRGIQIINDAPCTQSRQYFLILLFLGIASNQDGQRSFL